jgi:hypothetical protein
LLAELSQSSTESSSHQPTGGSSGSANLAATAWIKKEDDDGLQNTTVESEVDIGMTAAQLLSSCKAQGCVGCIEINLPRNGTHYYFNRSSGTLSFSQVILASGGVSSLRNKTICIIRERAVSVRI